MNENKIYRVKNMIFGQKCFHLQIGQNKMDVIDTYHFLLIDNGGTHKLVNTKYFSHEDIKFREVSISSVRQDYPGMELTGV